MVQEYMTVKQAAEFLQIAPRTIYKLIREGRIQPYCYAGTHNIRIKRSELFAPKERPGVCNIKRKS